MRHEVQVALLARLKALPGAPDERPIERLDSAVYTSAEQLDRERAVLFRRYPRIVGHASALREPGAFLTDDSGPPLLLVRTREGALKGFLNACRHRGTRLTDAPCGRSKAFVCPFHGWVYRLDGALLHVPMQERFPGLAIDELGLVEVPVVEAYGLLWALPTPGASLDVASHLTPALADDLAAFNLGDHHVFRQTRATRRCNWKLVMDAFLEGYHVQTLHRRSLYHYFGDGEAIYEHFDAHTRSVGPRKNLADATAGPPSTWDLRACATPFYHLFPNAVFVFHPDFVSLVTASPLALDQSCYQHTLLTPRAPVSDAEREHWERGYKLIEEQVFAREDLWIAEQIQATLSAGVRDAFVLGQLERPIAHFHQAIAAALA
ncbi:MAG: Rieske 2Fe-2S domain-containing protein [Myxococcales bacterium]|nr:Rieske 2Fe-2S domain-containing protein [Myxococcales bacterium]